MYLKQKWLNIKGLRVVLWKISGILEYFCKSNFFNYYVVKDKYEVKFEILQYYIIMLEK